MLIAIFNNWKSLVGFWFNCARKVHKWLELFLVGQTLKLEPFFGNKNEILISNFLSNNNIFTQFKCLRPGTNSNKVLKRYFILLGQTFAHFNESVGLLRYISSVNIRFYAKFSTKFPSSHCPQLQDGPHLSVGAIPEPVVGEDTVYSVAVCRTEIRHQRKHNGELRSTRVSIIQSQPELKF